MFLLHGGPGSSNLSLGFLATYLGQKRDVVVIGYRGADGETRFPFPSVRRAIHGFDFSHPDRSFRKIRDRFLDECAILERRGFTAKNYRIEHVVEDLEHARVSLGYDKIDLIAGSYGTRLAYLWGSKYPAGISRTVLVAANGPGRFVWEPAMIGNLWARISELWSSKAQPEASSEDVGSVFRRVLDSLPSRWGLLRLDRAKIELLVFFLLFDLKTVGSVVDAFLRAKQHDFSALAALSSMYGVVNATTPIIWGDMLLKGMSDYDPHRDYRRDMLPGSGQFNSYASYVYFGWLDEATQVRTGIPRTPWPEEASPVETLIVSGSIDFSTPSDFSRDELLPKLTNGRQVILAEAGHSNLWLGTSDRFRRLVQTFLESGDVDLTGYEYDALPSARSIPLVAIGWFLQVAKLAVLLTAGLAIVYAATRWISIGAQ